MGYKIIFAPQAVGHIAKDDTETALRVGNALIDRVAVLENFPLLGSPYPRRSGVRKLVARPCIIFYRVNPEKDSVDILRYWHGARGEPEFNEQGVTK